MREFDTSDVEPAKPTRRRRTITSIPLDEDDLLEPACVWEPRAPAKRSESVPAPETDSVPIVVED